MAKRRLGKYLAECGVASRRASEELIFDGLVKVNGKKILKPQELVDEEDQITVRGKRVKPPEEKVYFLLNKPRGYLCSNVRNTPNTKLVIDLFPEIKMRLFTAGRLDKESEGLIIVTNDGAFANRVIHPSANLTKLYIAKVDREVTIDHLKRLSRGCKVEGTNVVPVKVEKIRKNTIKIGVKEGKKREVRELLSSCDLECIALKRIQIGPYTLGTLPTGAYRQLSSKELALFS